MSSKRYDKLRVKEAYTEKAQLIPKIKYLEDEIKSIREKNIPDINKMNGQIAALERKISTLGLNNSKLV